MLIDPAARLQNILWGFLSFIFWINTFATSLMVNLLFLALCILFLLVRAQIFKKEGLPHIFDSKRFLIKCLLG